MTDYFTFESLQVFPKVTKCLFKAYGPSGTVQQFDAFCVLPVNILNEKVFIFLWFWYIILAVLTGIDLIYQVITLVFPSVRLFIFKRKAGKDTDSNIVEEIFRKTDIGDWFVLMLIRSNINQQLFRKVVTELGEKFKNKNT